MSRRAYLLLALLGLAMAVFVASFQSFPGYMDSDYYFAGGVQLALGKGFHEPYIWNYLDEPMGLPHPSHSYWMPLASVLSALGILIGGTTRYAAGRLMFILIAAIVPVATARLAFAFSHRAFPAVISGLLAVFSIYYAPFLPVSDNYGTYIVLGAAFMLLIDRTSWLSTLAVGLIAGIMSLARSDGVLWLFLGVIASIARSKLADQSSEIRRNKSRWTQITFSRVGIVFAGYLLATAWWTARNLEAYGGLRAPGAERLLWLSTYDEIFTYPPGILTAQTLWQHGLATFVDGRLAALRWNLLNAFAAQAGVFLLPFILIGAWQYRNDLRVRLTALGWLMLLVAMTVALPAIGARGGWFHAGAGFQAIWWSLAPLGLERVVAAARDRGHFTKQAQYVFGSALVGIAGIMTAYILWIRVIQGWGEGEEAYPAVDRFLVAAGARPTDVVMTRNPPGYYIMTNRSAIVIPYAGADGILAAARKYGADYLVIEAVGAAGPIRSVYDELGSSELEYLGEENGTRIFRIRP